MNVENRTTITIPNHFPECSSCIIARKRSAVALAFYTPLKNQELMRIKDITLACDIDTTPVIMNGGMTISILLNPKRNPLDATVEIPEMPVDCPHFPSSPSAKANKS